jgi:hypothetical protein
LSNGTTRKAPVWGLGTHITRGLNSKSTSLFHSLGSTRREEIAESEIPRKQITAVLSKNKAILLPSKVQDNATGISFDAIITGKRKDATLVSSWLSIEIYDLPASRLSGGILSIL